MKVHEETDKAASAEEAQDKLKAQIKLTVAAIDEVLGGR